MWVGDSKLKDLFPLLFRIAANNSAIVADLWGRQEGGGGGWEVHFRRPFQDWELEEVNRFLGYISAVRVQEGEDFLVWKIERKGSLRGMGKKRSVVWKMAPICLFGVFGRAKSKNLPRGRDDNTSLRKLFLRSLLECLNNLWTWTWTIYLFGI
ncbi:hypothetical protein CK203_019840 [Vitis vinifera]|uniref:Uncharacterized protein n=1 Tax=Vitis vinifera TaxID=29760 RepID=A0A438J2Y4_VITVI|nr:hypothetical protein CK203_019840 [Vitis vinifera]